jgi:hypothetical protein
LREAKTAQVNPGAVIFLILTVIILLISFYSVYEPLKSIINDYVISSTSLTISLIVQTYIPAAVFFIIILLAGFAAFRQ